MSSSDVLSSLSCSSPSSSLSSSSFVYCVSSSSASSSSSSVPSSSSLSLSLSVSSYVFLLLFMLLVRFVTHICLGLGPERVRSYSVDKTDHGKWVGSQSQHAKSQKYTQHTLIGVNRKTKNTESMV